MKLYYLAIPIMIGVLVGGVLSEYGVNSNNSEKITSTKLVENGSPIMGNINAPITILEWGDYQCTFCYKFHQNTLDIINEDFIKTGKVKIIFKDFPLNGPDSKLAAEQHIVPMIKKSIGNTMINFMKIGQGREQDG